MLKIRENNKTELIENKIYPGLLLLFLNFNFISFKLFIVQNN